MVTAADPNATFVSLYCEGKDPSHPHKRWMIGTFRPDERFTEDTYGHWIESVSGYQAPGSSELIPLNPNGSVDRNMTVFLAGNEFVSNRELSDDERDDLMDRAMAGEAIPDRPVATRSLYRLKCGRCPFNRQVAPSDLFPVLDVLSAHGVSVLSLPQLAARF